MSLYIVVDTVNNETFTTDNVEESYKNRSTTGYNSEVIILDISNPSDIKEYYLGYWFSIHYKGNPCP